jgi:hypothetical protein
MKTYTTVIQISATKFDVFKFNANIPAFANSGDQRKGILITIYESNKENDTYCFELSEKMNKEL